MEDPTVLIERQQLQQTKSIHELSKIRNLNELPIPGNVIRMPDVPLPKMKSILNVIARPPPRSSPRRTPKSETYKSFDPESGTVESTPLMDDRQLHSPFEAKSISFCAGYRLEGMWCPQISYSGSPNGEWPLAILSYKELMQIFICSSGICGPCKLCNIKWDFWLGLRR